jgi:hypothetical protein
VVNPLRSIVILLPAALLPVALAAQVSGAWSGCNMDSLATWNCARYYSGTVTMVSELKASGVDDNTVVTATVTAGKVTCRVKLTGTPEFEGPGMLAVEHESTENTGGYEIRVWCPEAAGERPTRRDASTIEVLHREAPDYTKLDDKESYEHPDADAVNGVTGNVTVTWHLERR